MRRRWPAIGLWVGFVLAACGDDQPPGPGERSDALWAEFLDDNAIRAELPWLAEHQVDLYLAIHSTRIGDPALAQLVRDAASQRVGVRAWLLLPEADGYWPNEHNIPATRHAVLAFAQWRQAESLPIDWIVFDLEMPLARTRAVTEAIGNDGQFAGIELIKQGRDPVAFAAHRAELAALIDEVHALGLRAAAVTYPMVLDDAGDGDTDIEDELDVPITGIDWDEASFMVYQSLIYDFSGEWHGQEVIHSYATTAREQWGDRAAVALGIVGTAGIDPVAMPYPDAATLAADRAAARAAGVDRVSAYSLDGVLQMPAAERAAWLDPGTPPGPLGDDIVRDFVVGLLD
ncbi:MAG: hypothetical protein AB7P03_28455 [Kofleriaceae bacterium]